MKTKLLMCILASSMMILGNVGILKAEEVDPNETDPEKVFPRERVEELIEEANRGCRRS